MEVITPEQEGFKRTETGLWIPDLETAGLNALKIKEEGVLISDMMDPAEHAKSNCKFCHGKGEMQRMQYPGTTREERVKIKDKKR